MNRVKRLVIFAILMENGDGIVEKSPEYILEKYSSALSVSYPEELLDTRNKAKLKRWLETWG